MKLLSKENKSSLLIAISAICYGFTYIFATPIMHSGFSPYTALFWRFFIASLVFFIILFFEIRKIKFSAKSIIFLISSSFLCGIAASLYFTAAYRIGSGLAVFLLFTHPVTVLLFNRFFFKISITRNSYISLAMVFVGALLITNIKQNADVDLVGIAIAIASSIFLGLYIVSTKQNKENQILSSFVICFGSALVCLIFAIIDSSFQFPSSENISHILLIGTLCAALPIFLFLKGVRNVSSQKAAIISMLEPVSVMIVGFSFLNETIELLQLCGALIIISATVIMIIDKKV